MKEGFNNLYRQFAHQGIPLYVRDSFRLYPDMGDTHEISLDQVRRATYANWREMGLDELVEDDLGATLYEGDDYAIIAQIKNATDTDYDLMLIVLPHDEDKIVHTYDELPSEVRDRLFDFLDLSVRAVTQSAIENGDVLRRVYVHQHVGRSELNGYPFNISFPQLHMHVMAVTQRDVDQSREISRAELIRRENRNSYTDPTVLIAKDILDQSGLTQVDLDCKTSSIVLAKGPLSLKIPTYERELLPDLYRDWDSWWTKLASIFSDMEVDENQRLVVLPRIERRLRLSDFLERFPFFGRDSRLVLEYLAENISDFDPEKLKSALYSGMAGSVGWVHNFDENTTELRFGPRVLTSSKKMGGSDGFYVGIKDKSRYMPEVERQQRLNVQRQLFRFLKTMSAEYQKRHRVEGDLVVKERLRFTPEEILNQYNLIKAAGIRVGSRPEFGVVEDQPVQFEQLVEGVNGAEYLKQCTDVEALEFFEEVILKNVSLVWGVQNHDDKVWWSLDLVPHNFVGKKGDFVYIDYEPSHLDGNHRHFLCLGPVLNYALVKFGRERPELMPGAAELICDFFPSTKDYLSGKPYIKYLNDEMELSEALSLTETKDDTLGLLLAFIERAFGGYGCESFKKELVEVMAYKICKYDPARVRSILSMLT